MMDEYILLLLFVLFRFCFPEENELCHVYLDSKEEGKKISFDLNRFRGLQMLPLVLDSPNGGRWIRLPPFYIFISLCEPLTNVGYCRNTTGQVCIYTEEVTDEFKKVYKRQYNVNDTIVPIKGSSTFLDFDLVEPTCYGESGKKFVVHFHVSCDPTGKARQYNNWAEWNGPETCEVHVYWTVYGYCAEVEKKFPCDITLGNNITVDLSPLKNVTFWTWKEQSNIFQFNICGPVRNGSCNGALCMYDERKKIGSTLADSTFVYYNPRRGIAIGFHPNINKGAVQTELWLECVSYHQDYKGPVVIPEVRYLYPSLRLVTIQTSIGCYAPPSVCVAVDEETGHHYNLYSLAGEVFVFPYGPTKIIISVCGPIKEVYDKNVPCSGPGIASCHIHKKQVIRVMGMQGLPPRVTQEGAIRIEYPNGDPCPYGDGGQRYRTFLDLYCDKTGVRNRVEGDKCDIFVKYSTPAACQTKDVMGKSCKVTDPLRNISMDLNLLSHEKHDWTLPLASYSKNSIRFNLCRQLVDECAGVKDTSVCLYLNNTMYAIGAPALYPKYNEATVKFDLYGPACKQGTHYTKVTIMISCDRDTKPPGIMNFIAGDACHFYVIWQSSVVCPPYEEGLKCNVQNGETGDWLDLTPLSEKVSTINATIPTKDGFANVDFYLNVCRSVIVWGPRFGHYSPCPLHSEICMRVRDPKDPLNKEKFRIVSLGEGGDSGPVIHVENDSPMIHFKNGDMCNHEENVRYTSAITFLCDFADYKKPIYELSKSSQCHIQITWPTTQACKSKVQSQDKADGCWTVNPTNNQSFNLSPLKNKVWVMSGSYEHDGKIDRDDFYISICSPIPRAENFSYCGYGAASCMVGGESRVGLGQSSEDLTYTDHRLVLNYRNGRYCLGSEMYHTEVSFICANEFFPRSGPQFVYWIACKFYFVFYTDLACEKKSLSCTVDTTIYGDGVDISLVSLMRTTFPYRVEGSDGHVFLLNVCGPLPTVLDSKCKRGSAACIIQSDNRLETTYKSLGYPITRPVLDHLPGDKKPQVVWKYTGGDLCNSHSNIYRSANIRFICDPNVGSGRPKYEGRSEDSCVYNFSWNTSVVCIEEKVVLNRSSCMLTNHATQEVYNLSELYPEELKEEMMKPSKPSQTGENLYIYLCFWPQHWMNIYNTVECKDTAVCANFGGFKGYGFQPFPYYDKNNNTIKIFFRGTYRDSCSHQEISGAEIWFPCATDGRTHKPKLLAATECHVVIEWPSTMFCPPGYAFPKTPTQIRTAWKTMLSILVIAAVVCGVVYLVRETSCLLRIRERVGRGRGGGTGYNHSPIVIYTADTQEEEEEEAERETFSM